MNESCKKNAAEREDLSFFMSMQRQLSKKMEQPSTYGDQLLFANKPQVIRKESPMKDDGAPYSSRQGMTPQKGNETKTSLFLTQQPSWPKRLGSTAV